MQCLKKILNQKILIITAHPDDETLWFFQFMQDLKDHNEVMVFCLTHKKESNRGQELLAISEKFNLQIIYGSCEDTGINRLLNETEVKQIYIKIFSKYKFDLAITHPPHGGEKPHPHHIQLFRLTRDFCRYHRTRFGFFSDQKILLKRESTDYYILNFKRKKYIFNSFLQCYHLMVSDKKRLGFLFEGLFNLLFWKQKFSFYQIKANIEEKHKALSFFKSQLEILKNYQSYNTETEFLYLEEKY